MSITHRHHAVPHSLTPTLDAIAAHGNTGHRVAGNNIITCRDGITLSVIAGGGAYCIPRVRMCTCRLHELLDDGVSGTEFAMPGAEAHTYPGPYTGVEVLSDDLDIVAEMMPVDEVRDIILEHGGEIQQVWPTHIVSR